MKAGAFACLISRLSRVRFPTPHPDMSTYSDLLKYLDIGYCTRCGRDLGRDDYAWTNGENIKDEPFTFVQIICSNCGEEVFSHKFDYPGCDNHDEVLQLMKRLI